ncbi:MAG: hypothetical protein M3Y21_05500 [Candidatus Eremiobacteraeota bacterium]|nr:hypothetical protein [Candidatus Eremiobacteraeota bacterium]
MSDYRAELQEIDQRGAQAHDAIEAWLSRPFDAPDDVPAAVLEAHARTLRGGRERIQELIAEQGTRDNLTTALETNTARHKNVGLSIADERSTETDVS